MRRFWKAAAVAIGALAVPMFAIPASAVPPGFPVTGYGFDGEPNVIVGGGRIRPTPRRSTSACFGSAVRSPAVARCTTQVVRVPARNTKLNECTSNTDDNANLGNYDGDTIGQANAVGSSGGVRSLNGFGETATDKTTYQGSANPVGAGYDPACINATTKPNVDFARSSSSAPMSGTTLANATCGGTGNTLAADTYWGFARDGITWIAFNARATAIRALAGSGELSPSEIANMYNCTYDRWGSDVPGLGITLNGPGDGPIVPWTMNDSSGTRSTGINFLINQGGAGAGFNPDTIAGACTQYLGTGTPRGDVTLASQKPLENDIKPLVDTAR